MYERMNEWMNLCAMLYGRLGGVVVSMLATGPKGRGFEPGQDDRFFKDDKNPQHTFLRMGSKAGGPMS
jgi:hypothetical protein